VADLTLDRQILQEICVKRTVKPRQLRRLARWAEETYQVFRAESRSDRGNRLEHVVIYKQ
jgi:hypothetical protein